jgi:carbamoyl-phosphate synthase large subunit
VYSSTEHNLRKISQAIVQKLNITGPFNIQYLYKDNEPFVIEVNARASRTFPMLSKALDVNLPELAVDAYFNKAVKQEIKYPHNIIVKSPQFSFSRLSGADPVLRVEMASTGEVACFGETYDEALLKSILASTNFDFSKKIALLSLGGSLNKEKFLPSARLLKNLGYTIYATNTTAEVLKERGIECEAVKKAYQAEPNFLQLIESKKVGFVVNLSQAKPLVDEKAVKQLSDGYRVRRATVDNQIPLFTDLHLARAFVLALSRNKLSDLKIKSYKEYLKK